MQFCGQAKRSAEAVEAHARMHLRDHVRRHLQVDGEGAAVAAEDDHRLICHAITFLRTHTVLTLVRSTVKDV